MSAFDFYRCESCGNMVASLREARGTLTCCGHPMTKLEANSTDAAKEKHVPDVTKEDGRVKVSVGSILHPMLQEHYIEWIALGVDDRVEIKFLKPGEEAKADFAEVSSGTVYAYCNLHGLWKAEF